MIFVNPEPRGGTRIKQKRRNRQAFGAVRQNFYKAGDEFSVLPLMIGGSMS